MSFLDWIWLIPLFPLFGAAAMLLVGKKLDPQHAVEHGQGHPSSGLGKTLIAIFCPGMVLLSFLLSAAAVIELATSVWYFRAAGKIMVWAIIDAVWASMLTALL